MGVGNAAIVQHSVFPTLDIASVIMQDLLVPRPYLILIFGTFL